MSGEKRTYVSVEEQELRRLREQESRLRNVQSDLPDRLNAIRRQAQQEMQNRLAPLQERQRRQENMIRGLGSDLADLERDTCRRFQQQQAEFISALDGQHNEFMSALEDQRGEFISALNDQRGEYLSLFREQDHKFTSMIADERRARREAVNRLQGQIDAIMSDAARKQDSAQTFVADLNAIISEMDHLPHQRFAPGELDDIRRHVDDAVRSVNAGMPEAALSTAQNAYWQAADLRAVVLQKEREFFLLHQAALEEARSLIEEARANRQYQLEVGEGAEKDVFELEVDHWTRGELSAHEQEIGDLEQQLLDGEGSLTTDQVKEILAQIDALKPKTIEIVEHARQNILASQLRVNIAELAVESLAGEGFTVDDAAYEGDDERNAYVVKVRNRAESEVVTVIRPVEGDYGKNEVSVHSYDETFVDDATLRVRSEEIVNIFRDEGLVAASPACAGEAKQEYRDMNAVKRASAETRSR